MGSFATTVPINVSALLDGSGGLLISASVGAVTPPTASGTGPAPILLASTSVPLNVYLDLTQTATPTGIHLTPTVVNADIPVVAPVAPPAPAPAAIVPGA